MLSIALAVFAAAMLFATVRHVLALVRREHALKEMHVALAVAGRPRRGRAMERGQEKSESFEGVAMITGEQPIDRGVLVGAPPELRREADPSDSGAHVARSAVV